MGIEISRYEFSEKDYEAFRKRLAENLDALEVLLDAPNFGAGPSTLGAELELYLVNSSGKPLYRNEDMLTLCNDPKVSLELNRYNLEYNLSPVKAAGRPFSSIEREMSQALTKLDEIAERLGGKIAAIGILPTLKRRDFGPHAMTPLPRYVALTKALQGARGSRFRVTINGPEPISLRPQDVTLEGANTSMQFHIRVRPADFADLFNAVQFITPVALGIAGNSPFLLGRRLWHETRIPLFKLAIDGRSRDGRQLHIPARVSFGNGWVRKGALEQFAASVYLHSVMLPLSSRENARIALKKGKIPSLYELRLHQGTTWPWNRTIFDPGCGGHLRIEMRALPSGPSPCDMMANAAFAVGAAKGLQHRINELLPALPFETASYNFYRAAEHGIDAQLLWPRLDRMTLQPTSLLEIAQDLLPVAAQGLEALQVAPNEISHYLNIIRERLARRCTGALWQMRQAHRLQQKHTPANALRLMVQDYIQWSAQNIPIARWGSGA